MLCLVVAFGLGVMFGLAAMLGLRVMLCEWDRLGLGYAWRRCTYLWFGVGV